MRKRRWLEPTIALVLPSFVFLASIFRAGIWDPYELGVADLARRAAIHLFGAESLVLQGAENRIPTLGDLGRGELPITSMAFSFKLFGLSEWSGRLPLALYGIAGLVVVWLFLRRMITERAGTYAALFLATTPLYFVQARTMLGDVATMASLACAFAGLSVAVLDERRGRAPWLVLGLVGLAAAFDCRGGLIGVAVPCFAVVCAAMVAGADALGKRIAVGLALAGGISTYLAVRGYRDATTASFDRFLGAGVVHGQKFPTFDNVLQHLGHSLFPWSALLPVALGRLFAEPPGVTGDARTREARVRAMVIVGSALAFGAYGFLATRVGQLPFGAVCLFAIAGAIVLHDFERGAHPSRALAVASGLLAAIFFEDLDRFPEKALSAFCVANATFPESFKPTSLRLLEGATAIFVASTLFAFLDANDPAFDDPDAPAYRRFTAWDDVKHVLEELNDVWEGNLAFFGVMLEAMLIGVGALLYFGDRFHWKIALRETLSGELKIAAINAWWALPLALVGGLFVFLTARKLFRMLVARTRVPRAWFAAFAGVGAGSVLSLGYYPALAAQLSPKEVFDAYRVLHRAGEPLGLLNVAGRSVAYYASSDAKTFADPESAFEWLVAGTERRFLATRADDVAKLNSLYRAHAKNDARATPDHNLPIVDARSSQIQLVSNQLTPGETNQSRLTRIVSSIPPQPQHAYEANLDDQLLALGWDVWDASDEKRVDVVLPGRTYVLRLYFKVLAPVTQQWKSFIHIDGYGRRFNGDHDVFDGKYPMSLWQTDDFVTDHYEMKLEPNFTPGDYELFYGFFQGEKRLAVKSGRAHDNRIDGGIFRVR